MAESKSNELMEKIVSLCKRRGFVYQSSEIYGGLQATYDYGPAGVELKRLIKDDWWREGAADWIWAWLSEDTTLYDVTVYDRVNAMVADLENGDDMFRGSPADAR